MDWWSSTWVTWSRHKHQRQALNAYCEMDEKQQKKIKKWIFMVRNIKKVELEVEHGS